MFGDIVCSDERGIFVTFNRVPHAPAHNILSEPNFIVELPEQGGVTVVSIGDGLSHLRQQLGRIERRDLLR